MYDTQVWAHSTNIREEINETRRSNYNLLGPASLPCLSRDLLVSLKNSNANSLILMPQCGLFYHTWTLQKTIPGIFFSLSFTPTPSLRFLKVYYFTKLKYVHEIQFTLILLWWDIFWELKPKNFFFVERSTNVLSYS